MDSLDFSKTGILRVVRLSVKMLGGRNVGEVEAPQWSSPTADGLCESISTGLSPLDLCFFPPHIAPFSLCRPPNTFTCLKSGHFQGVADRWSYILRKGSCQVRSSWRKIQKLHQRAERLRELEKMEGGGLCILQCRVRTHGVGYREAAVGSVPSSPNLPP